MAGASAFGGSAHRSPGVEGRTARVAEPQLAETAVRPMAAVTATPTVTPTPSRRPLTEQLVSEAKRWFASTDPTWAMVLAIGVGSMVVVFLLGLILLLH